MLFASIQSFIMYTCTFIGNDAIMHLTQMSIMFLTKPYRN
jgi:hypothetical protein